MIINTAVVLIRRMITRGNLFRRWIATILGILLTNPFSLSAAPGDLKLEIMASTGDENLIAGFDSITSFEYFVSLDSAPIAIDEFGFISFAASVEVNGKPEYGFYQAFRPGAVSTIMQTDGLAPGVVVNDPNGARIPELEPSPKRGYAVSESGLAHAVTVFTNGSGGFLYGAEAGVLNDFPTTWPERFSPTHNPWEAVDISDGRGTVKTRSGGSGSDMVVSDSGAIYWDAGGNPAAILRSLAPGNISAVMFTGTPAPGYDPAENAILDAPYRFRGIDGNGNAYFHCRVTKASGISNAVFRHNILDDSLSLLWDGVGTTLPGGSGLEGVNVGADAESVFVTKNGALYLRGGASTFGGFWRITLDEQDTLATELLGLFYSNGFSPTMTDMGQVIFRTIGLADWAVTENGTVFFSADVAGSGGEPTSAMEGIWKIDPTDLSVKTVARFGQNADSGGTDATYKKFSDLTAAGDDKLAFIAELSDGNRGLFGTDENGGVVKIAIEGSPLVACEDPQSDSLECEIVTLIEFTPDHAGEDLIYSKGAPGLNKHGEVAFLATLESQVTALVRAKFEGEERPVGTTFIWDGGAGTNDWYTITDGRSNWTDIAGVPWDKAPGLVGNEKVFITTGANVELKASVSIRELTLDVSTLTLASTLEFTHFFNGAEGSVLNLESGAQITSDGDFNTSGAIVKNGDGAATVKIDDFEVNGGSVTLKSGTLNFENTISNFVDTVVLVEGGLFAFDENVTAFRGADTMIVVKNGTLDLDVFALSFEDGVQLEAESSGATIRMGRSEGAGAASIALRSGSSTEPRSLVLMGDGEFELRRDINFLDGDSFINNHSGIEGTGLFINIAGDEALTIPNESTFVNNGILVLQDGGLVYAIEPDATGRIINSGEILIPAGNSFGELDCTNEGSIILEGDLSYGNVQFVSRSKLRTTGGSLMPLDPATSKLRFERGSEIIGTSEESSVEFPTEDEVSFEGEVEILEGATLNIASVNVGQNTRMEVGNGGVLSLENLKFDSCLIKGLGKVVLKGSVEPLVAIRSELCIATLESRLEEVVLHSDQFTSYCFEPYRAEGVTSFPRTESTSEFVGVNTKEGALIEVEAGARVKIEDTLILNSTIRLKGVLEAADNISYDLGDGKVGTIDFGNSDANDSAGEDIATIEIRPDLPEPIVIESDLVLSSYRATLLVGKNSRVSFAGFTEGYIEDSILMQGTIIIEDFASCYIGSENLSEISRFALVSIGKPHPTLSSVFDLPNPENALSVKGTLILNDATLDMGGNTLRFSEQVIESGNSKIIGNVESVRDAVQGTPTLAGNINIEGNLSLDGNLALGASPGTGLITGDLTLFPGSDVQVEFAGSEPGTGFDFLEVGGTANLDGKLTLSLIDEYVPENGAEFLFLKAGTVSGSFDDIDQGTLGRQRRFDVTDGAEGLTATMQALSIASYADWRAAFFSETEAADDLISGVGADPDNDGIVNLAEYLSNGLPKGPSLEPLMLLQDSPDTFLLQLANGVADYNWQLETSTALEGWSAVDVNVTELSEEEDVSFFGLDLLTPAADGDRFYRLGIDTVP